MIHHGLDKSQGAACPRTSVKTTSDLHLVTTGRRAGLDSKFHQSRKLSTQLYSAPAPLHAP